MHLPFCSFHPYLCIRWLAVLASIVLGCTNPEVDTKNTVSVFATDTNGPVATDIDSSTTPAITANSDSTTQPSTSSSTTGHSETDDGSTSDNDTTAEATTEANPDSAASHTGDESSVLERQVTVFLDGVPTSGIVVKQGGTDQHFITGNDGRVRIPIDARPQIGEIVIHASHPEARIGYAAIDLMVDEDIVIQLERYDPRDNEEYLFYPPGTPENRLYCAHCHPSINNDWYESPHRSSAKNPVVQDLYAGVATALDQEEYCIAKGGNWWKGIKPGTEEPQYRCYLGAGALPDLNRNCGTSEPCDERAQSFGGCADCHAPGINGKLGDRDLLEAQGIAYEFGVHCDVCHKVESIDLNAPPGVAGRLKIHRPMEPSPVVGDIWKPLSFGPFADVSNLKMGAVVRDHFGKSEFCAGCHQHEVRVEARWGSIDVQRWPDGQLPIQSTYEEWKAGPFSSVSPCISCHMPPDPSMSNAADLQSMIGNDPGTIAGWPRPPGTVRQHSWKGPRQPWSGMLENAAAVFIEKSVAKQEGNSELVTKVTVRNVGCGHALPTGEPMRSMILVVQASCNGSPLDATGGATIPDFGGWLDRRFAQQDWKHWPGARTGDIVHVTRYTGQWYDYQGFGPFGNGRFSPQEKGMRVEEFVQSSTIIAMNGDIPTFEPPLAKGDVAYRGEVIELFPANDQPYDGRARALAGSPGFAFARVLQGTDGSVQVPHFRARDVVSDNRLLPQQDWTSEHRFRSTCDDPQVRALLIYRPYPLHMARQRDWDDTNPLMVSTWR